MFKPSHIATQVAVTTWQEALRAAGQLLVDAGACTSTYVEATVTAVAEMGPYIVLAPQVALAHARPSQAVLSSDMAVIVLKTPVCFGAGDNDPVKLVFAFCATDQGSHLKLLSQLATLLESPAHMKALATAQTPAQVLQCIRRYT